MASGIQERTYFEWLFLLDSWESFYLVLKVSNKLGEREDSEDTQPHTHTHTKRHIQTQIHANPHANAQTHTNTYIQVANLFQQSGTLVQHTEKTSQQGTSDPYSDSKQIPKMTSKNSGFRLPKPHSHLHARHRRKANE